MDSPTAAAAAADLQSTTSKRKIGTWNVNHPTLESFRSTVELDFEQLLREFMPQKLQELSEWLRSFPHLSSHGPTPSSSSSSSSSSASGTDASGLASSSTSNNNVTNGNMMITSNDMLLRQWIDRLQEEIILFLSIIEKLKLGIELRVPRIEDGNNFGVSIQEDMISELARVQESALHILDSSVKYYAGRAKLCSKVSDAFTIMTLVLHHLF